MSWVAGSGSSNGAGGVELSLSLAISSAALEKRYWTRRCQSRLMSLDSMYELCNGLLWLSILPSLAGSERTLGKARLLLAAAQLAVLHLAPRAWLSHRTWLLSGAQLVRVALLLPWPAAVLGPPPLEPQLVLPPDAPFGTVMSLASGCWGHLLFVLFHQLPVTVQAPLLAASAAAQGLHLLRSTFQQAGLQSLAASLTWAFDQLVTGLLGNLPAGGGSGDNLGAGGNLGGGGNLGAGGNLGGGGGDAPSKAAVLTTVLFLHLFGGLLLPLFLAYIMEWKSKVSFLLCECSSHSAQLSVLTPAAAIVRGSVLLSGLLYLGWTLLMAITSWFVCSTVAELILDSRQGMAI